MINLTANKLQESCYKSETFETGKFLYQNGKVKNINFNLSKQCFTANIIDGKKMHKVEIILSDDGLIDDYKCDCKEKSILQFYGYCEHVVALMLTLIHSQNEGKLDIASQRLYGKRLLDSAKSIEYFPPTPSKKLKTELNCYFKDAGSSVEVSLRIGNTRLYTVRDFYSFLESVENRRVYNFTNNFSYDPKIIDFGEEFSELIAFFSDIKDIEHRSSVYGKPKTFFNGKFLTLYDNQVDKFISLLKDINFNVFFNNTLLGSTSLTNERLPILFSLAKNENFFELMINSEYEMYPLTSNAKFFWVNNKIYTLSTLKAKGMQLFLTEKVSIKSKKFLFPLSDGNKLANQILPIIYNIGDIDIYESANNLIVNEEFSAKIYLDKAKRAIKGRVYFVYGKKEINPFAVNQNIDDNLFYVRDQYQEQYLLSILDEYNFNVNVDGIYLNNDAHIYSFFETGIDKLKEIAEVYYSEEFTKARKAKSLKWKGKVDIPSHGNWLEINFDIENVNDDELEKLYRALINKNKYLRLEDGSFLDIRDDAGNYKDDEFEEIEKMLNTIDNFKDLKEFKRGAKVPISRSFYYDQYIKGTKSKNISAGKGLLEFQNNIANMNDEVIYPEKLDNILRDYQKLGVQWLSGINRMGLGGILADDMGLGKTLQVLALLTIEKAKGNLNTSLIVTPTSLVYNWLAEIEKFTPELTVTIIDGAKNIRDNKIKESIKYDICITSYPLIRKDYEEYADIEFSLCILDEAQYIKNPSSIGSKAVKTINAKSRFALTGTPMENNLSELWSVFDFVLPGYLYTHSKFMDFYANPITKQNDNSKSKDLSHAISPFLLRRVKSDVLLELPDKINHDMVCSLEKEQKQVYLAYKKSIEESIYKSINEVGFNRSHMTILAGLTRLRQICCHPKMFIPEYNGTSGKLQLLHEIIEESLSGGHRILIFSQFTSLLGIIKEEFDNAGYSYYYLDGSTKMEKRCAYTKEFNEGNRDMFLISLKAGGTGLNLTGADTVIHLDPWWNPAVENQATDRAHRIGQEKIVHVIKLITKGTIEEKIVEMQDKKKALIDAVIKPGETLISKLSESELRDLFRD